MIGNNVCFTVGPIPLLCWFCESILTTRHPNHLRSRLDYTAISQILSVTITPFSRRQTEKQTISPGH